MKLFRVLSLACLSVGVVACGDEDTSATTDTTTADTSGDTSTTQPTTADTTQAETTPSGTSALTGVKYVDTGITAATPNAACAGAGTPTLTTTSNARYPFAGATIGGTAYTCNGCPGGHPDLQGRWRVHGFEEGDLNAVDYSFYNDSTKDAAVDLFVDGNTFMFIENDPDNLQSITYSRGFYFCSMKPENNKQHLFWNTLSKEPGGAAANEWYETDTILSQGASNVAYFFFNDIGGTTGIWYAFCRIGTTGGGTTCNDPFVH